MTRSSPNNHALDVALARALQTGVERFAKPWYRPRALRVFRDTTNLAANPDLWSFIQMASAWLVLMASPNAAQSRWVNREVAWWMENKSPQRLLVLLTEVSSPGTRAPDTVMAQQWPCHLRYAAPSVRKPVIRHDQSRSESGIAVVSGHTGVVQQWPGCTAAE
jgi:hypothetical protein